MFIYKITNNINEKVYIGQTIRPIEQRFKRHINDAINNILDTHFARAIRKYGKENFSIEQIDEASDQEELNKKEQFWIQFYNSTVDGYNETDALFKCGGNTYKNKTNEELSKIQDKIRITKIGNKNPNSRKIKCLNIKTNEELIFDTVEECRIYFSEKTHRFVTTRVTKRTKSYYKNIWNIAYYDEEYCCTNKINKKGISILAENLLTNSKKIYESIRLASRECNINRNKIREKYKKEKEFVIDNYKFTIL